MRNQLKKNKEKERMKERKKERKKERGRKKTRKKGVREKKDGVIGKKKKDFTNAHKISKSSNLLLINDS